MKLFQKTTELVPHSKWKDELFLHDFSYSQWTSVEDNEILKKIIATYVLGL